MAEIKIIIPENQDELLSQFHLEKENKFEVEKGKYRKVVQAGIAK